MRVGGVRVGVWGGREGWRWRRKREWRLWVWLSLVRGEE